MTDLEGTVRWSFDSWSPRDGIAFASRRNATVRIRTVFIRPPEWRPVAVGPAIALSAGRGGFQRGFFTEEQEATFATLDELIDVVRQAYILGGGPPPSGEKPGEPRGSSPPGPLNIGQWARARSKLLANDAQSLKEIVAADAQHRFEQWMRWLADVTLRGLFTSVRRRGGATRQDLWDWITVLCRMGIWDDVDQMHDSLSRDPQTHRLFHRHLGSRFGWPDVLVGVSMAKPMLGGLLFRVPFATGKSVGHWLVGVMGDRGAFARLDPSGLARLLFCSCAVIAAAGQPGFALLDADDGRRELRRAGVAWISSQQPRVESSSPAGKALTDFAAKNP